MEQAQAAVRENDVQDDVKPARGAEPDAPPPEVASMPLFVFRSSAGPDAGAGRPPERGRPATAMRGSPPASPDSVLRWAEPPAPEPEPDDLLPPHGVARLRHVLAEYRTFPVEGLDPALCLHRNPQAVTALEQFSQRPRSAPATWEDLDRLELALLWVTPPDILRRQAPHVRARYRQAFGPNALLRFAPPPSPEPHDAEADGRLRADLEVLLSETQKQRVLSEAQARAQSAAARSSALWCFRLFLIGLAGLLAAQFLPLPLGLREAFALSLAMLVGALGGLVSLLDAPAAAVAKVGPKADRIVTGAGLSPVYPVKGAALAALLYCLMAGVSGGDWPFGLHAGFLPAPATVARLIAWSFLAGLAPRSLSLLWQTGARRLRPSLSLPPPSLPADRGG